MGRISLIAIVILMITLFLLAIFGKTKSKNNIKTTSNAEEFDKYFDENLKEEAKQMKVEGVEKKQTSPAVIFVIIFVLLPLTSTAISSFVSLLQGRYEYIFQVIAVVPLAAFIIVLFKNNSKLTAAYKNKVIANMLHDHFEGSVYSPNQGIPTSEFSLKKYLPHYNEYYTEDLLILPFRDKKITLADVLLIDEQTDSDGDTTRTVVFRGLVGYFDLKETKLEHDLYVGNCLSLNKNIKMDSEVFKKNFNVISKEEVQAYKILTPANMEKLLELKKEIPTIALLIDKSFTPNRLYFCFQQHAFFEYVKDKEENSKALAYTHDLLEKIIKMCEVIEDEINDKLV